ncbi:hypothetical protein CEXT_801731 [Caerostris extrusa]|uniref:Uncharacterized protein n=1 Tax=Caerostris extrusa TaxID=172846 RepID=A0AAV4M9W8_CAEEX|nr:hypothetical protein CEXT_801731 [Caerostris extrusa]
MDSEPVPECPKWAGLRLFGRDAVLWHRTTFFIGVIDLIFLPWLAWIVVIYVSFLENRSSCSSHEGTISNPEPRYHVATVTYVKLFVCILDLMLAIYGTIVLYRGDFCDIIGVFTCHQSEHDISMGGNLLANHLHPQFL